MFLIDIDFSVKIKFLLMWWPCTNWCLRLEYILVLTKCQKMHSNASNYQKKPSKYLILRNKWETTHKFDEISMHEQILTCMQSKM